MKQVIIKNMVCDRCIQAVRDVFEQEHIAIQSMGLGWVKTTDAISKQSLLQLGKQLERRGFEILDSRQSILIETLKKELRLWVYSDEESRPLSNVSAYLAHKVNKDYSYLSRLFSEVEGQTIEKYLKSLKIERAKELLMYDQLSLSEIADKLNYANASYLAALFKRETGMTTSAFKKRFESKRKGLDKL